MSLQRGDRGCGVKGQRRAGISYEPGNFPEQEGRGIPLQKAVFRRVQAAAESKTENTAKEVLHMGCRRCICDANARPGGQRGLSG